MSYIKYILSLFLVTTVSYSQGLELSDWESFTSYYNVVSSTVDSDDNLWFGTLGGVFTTDISGDEYQIFNNTNGLSKIAVSSIEYISQEDILIIGYNDGTLDFYEDGEWSTILDIKNSGFVNPAINAFLYSDGKIYIAGGFGLAVFNPEERVFIEDVKRFANLPSAVEINNIEIFEGNIWVASNEGVAYTQLDNSISNRNDWISFVKEDFAEEEFDFIDFEISNSTLYMSTGIAVYSFDGNTLIEELRLSSSDINGLVNIENEIYYYTQREIRDLSTQSLFLRRDETINNVEMLNVNGINYLVINTSAGSFVFEGENEISKLIPNSPISNSFIDVFIDSQNRIWCGTGPITSRGLMLYEGDWKNFNTNNSNVTSNSFIRTNELEDGTIALSTFGGGVHYFEADTFRIINSDNSPLVGSDGGTFVITGDIHQDRNGYQWIVNWGNLGQGPLFVVRRPDGTFFSIDNCEGRSRRTYFKMAVDVNGTKWIGSSAANAIGFAGERAWGLNYYNDRNTPEDLSDDICGNITVSGNSGLGSDYQTALALDKQGTIWLGSNNGASRIINPSSVLFNSNTLIANVRPLVGQNIRSIVVDALDNKWIGTSNGVFVLDPEGTDIITRITTENSPLPTNDVYSLAYNENSGKVYIGTEQGLFSVTTSAIKPLPTFDLKVYPQPFNPDMDDFMTIEGLSENTDIRIVTVDGELVKKMKVQSRVATWDGTNEFGSKVSPGVYLLYSVSETNNETSVIKFAVRY